MARFTQDESPIVKKAAAEGITVDEYIERQEVIDHGHKKQRLQDKLDEESLKEKKSGKTLLGEYDKQIEEKAKLNRPEDKDFSNHIDSISQDSVLKQREIEQKDNKKFDEYLHDYFNQINTWSL